MWTPTYDPHNDQFAAALACPWPGCGEVDASEPLSDVEVWVCRACERPYEVVRLETSDALAGESPVVARRPKSLWCAKSGQALHGASAVDFDQAGGSAAHTNCLVDAAGRIFGAPSRTIEWDLELQWTEQRWGRDEDERPQEAITSVSAHRGVVLAASAAGRLGLFDAETGTPRLARSLGFPSAPFDATIREHALRLPVAFRRGHLCAATERFAVFRDLTTSLFPHAPATGEGGAQAVVYAAEGQQWIGPPLVCGGGGEAREAVVVLAQGAPQGPHLAPAEAALHVFALDGTLRARVEVEGLVRPPVALSPTLVATVTIDGTVVAVDLETLAVVFEAKPDAPLHLAPTERWTLVFAQGPLGGELWLADEQQGAVRVWRASLDRVRKGTFAWENRFESSGLGALLALAVGPVAAGRTHPASEHFVLTTERSVAAYARAMRHPAAEAVLAHAPRGPALLTSVGLLAQDNEGLWLRGLGAWSFRDDNLERFVRPAIPRPPPSLHDRTFAAYGRQVFFGTGGAVSAARLRRTSEDR